MSARSLMVLGTSSHVGKSMLTAALCRLVSGAGYKVTPFKAQNMSLNSAATPDGLEIGRAQALQAEAAGVPASVHMNPILLKPMGHAASQVVVRGKIWQTLDAGNYYQNRISSLWTVVEESYRILAREYEVIVIEGAGSPVEINLKQTDIVNMRVAKMSDAPCLLVGDIDRGGVFASLLGTVELLDEDERRLISGFVINKFRGDRHLLMPGVEMIERRLGIPCLGVIPYLHGFALDEEDSVTLEETGGTAWPEERTPERKLRIAVLGFPSLSNFTDFDSLRAEPSVSLRYIRSPRDLALADVVILPGSKQTVDDLHWLQRNGFAEGVRQIVYRGGWVIGICGGFQMLGREILDPFRVEGTGSEAGLGLLPVKTTLAMEKITVGACGVLCPTGLFERSGGTVQGYEIHLGQTEYLPGAIPFAKIARSTDPEQSIEDGCAAADGRVFGTYLHGIFDGDEFRHLFLKSVRTAAGLSEAEEWMEWHAHRQKQFDRLAVEFGRVLDLTAIFRLLRLPPPGLLVGPPY
jgi:adenosylcobyric acid synthase